MPFGKKGSFTKRKGAYKNRGRKSLDRRSNGEPQDTSDDFFRTCFFCVYTDLDICDVLNYANNESDYQLKADEYYVILDKPYQYYNDNDDLDAFVSAKKASIFNDLKEQTNNIDSSGFMCNKKSDSVCFISLYDEEIVKLKTAVTVSKDFDVFIQVHDRKLPADHKIWKDIPRVCYTKKCLQFILSIVSSYRICPGNPDPDLQEFIPMDTVSYSKDIPQRQGVRDNYTGKSTIVSCSCQLLAKGVRCACCTIYRKTLRVLLARKRKRDMEEAPNEDWLHCRLPNSRLTENQKCQKLKRCKEYIDTLEKSNSDLNKKIQKEIASKSKLLSQVDSNDFMTNLEALCENNTNSFKGNEQIYKQLFWKQQLKYHKLQDKRQMRWHPMIIRWCISLRKKSSSSYDMLRKSEFVSLPSERSLYDYTHQVKRGTKFKAETIDVINKEIHEENKPIDLPE